MNNEELTIFFQKNFRLTWQPTREKVKPYLLPRKRITITLEKLSEIIGEKRCKFLIPKIIDMQGDNQRFRVQNKGILDVYVK
jgi:hypothetical protein